MINNEKHLGVGFSKKIGGVHFSGTLFMLLTRKSILLVFIRLIINEIFRFLEMINFSFSKKKYFFITFSLFFVYLFSYNFLFNYHPQVNFQKKIEPDQLNLKDVLVKELSDIKSKLNNIEKQNSIVENKKLDSNITNVKRTNHDFLSVKQKLILGNRMGICQNMSHLYTSMQRQIQHTIIA